MHTSHTQSVGKMTLLLKIKQRCFMNIHSSIINIAKMVKKKCSAGEIVWVISVRSFWPLSTELGMTYLMSLPSMANQPFPKWCSYANLSVKKQKHRGSRDSTMGKKFALHTTDLWSISRTTYGPQISDPV